MNTKQLRCKTQISIPGSTCLLDETLILAVVRTLNRESNMSAHGCFLIALKALSRVINSHV